MKNWLQSFILTRWMWQFYQHEDTGQICYAPIWDRPNKRWHHCDWKE